MRRFRNVNVQPPPTCSRYQRTFRAPTGLVGHRRINCTTRTAPTVLPPSTSPSSSAPSNTSDRPPEPPLPSFSPSYPSFPSSSLSSPSLFSSSSSSSSSSSTLPPRLNVCRCGVCHAYQHYTQSRHTNKHQHRNRQHW
nr:unnamed protein product [Spirometra erinaceieuropaei]